MKPVNALATVIFGLTVVAFFVGLWADLPWLRLASKPVPVLLLAGLVLGRDRSLYGVLIGIGLLLSVAGDVLLEIPADLFVFGLGAFLLAHLAYIGAAVSASRRAEPLRALPFVLWCGGVYVWLLPQMGDLAVPVGIYVSVIGIMLWRMAARVDGTDRMATVAFVGALAFALSDSIIAVRKFSGDFTGAREAIMVLYWAGQVGIAGSVLWATGRDPQD
jgi:uncharacterized membrane protein YhhN